MPHLRNKIAMVPTSPSQNA